MTEEQDNKIWSSSAVVLDAIFKTDEEIRIALIKALEETMEEWKKAKGKR